MSKIVHVCSSALVRPNGIVRYINTVIALQKLLGHEVIFVCDSTPSQKFCSPVDFARLTSTYQVDSLNGHAWLNVDYELVHQIHAALKNNPADLYISHDLMSYLALEQITSNGIFVQHETDILTPGHRYSYLSDEWLSLQNNVIANTKGRVGFTIKTRAISPKNPVYTPIPFTRPAVPRIAQQEGLLYMGDASERKGAQEFMRVARLLAVTPTVITHEQDHELFAGARVHTFSLGEHAQMMALVAQHKVAYMPSRNECPGLAVLECMWYMPTVVLADYPWTQCLLETDAVIVHQIDAQSKIQQLLATTQPYSPVNLAKWCAAAVSAWSIISKV